MLENNTNNISSQPEVQSEPTPTPGDWNMATESFQQADSVGQIYASSHTTKNHSALLLLGICLLSIVGVYIFGQYQKPKQATEEEKAAELQVDTALAKLVTLSRDEKTEQMFKDTETMVQAFYDYPANQQVAVDDLQKNPFARVASQKTKKKADRDDERARLQKELQTKIDALKLDAVMQTSAGAKCLINNEVKGVGDTVLDTFTIQSLDQEQAVLVHEDFTFVLNMDK